jgi:type I restriction enzyme S subunit
MADIVPGFAFKGEHFGDTGTVVIKIKDIVPPIIDLAGAQRVDVSHYSLPKLEKYKLRKEDYVVAMTGATIGKVGRLMEDGEAYINQRVAKIAPKNPVDRDFVYYCIVASDFGDFVQNNIDSHSAQENISGTSLGRYPINSPLPAEQRAIASVLSSFDDKIDLLHRQNKTLEAMAETLFRQWFVEEAQEDWEVVSLGAVTSRITDGAHQSPPTIENGMPMASVKDMYEWGINTDICRHISRDDFDALVAADCRPLKNDILIAKDGSFLKHVFVVEEDMDIVILSSIAILRPNERYHPLLLATFLKLESTLTALENIVTGAVIPRIVLKDFRKFELSIPPKKIQESALVYIQPIYQKCWANNRQIRALEKLRDTLLPKLMSGEVRVTV